MDSSHSKVQDAINSKLDATDAEGSKAKATLINYQHETQKKESDKYLK